MDTDTVKSVSRIPRSTYARAWVEAKKRGISLSRFYTIALESYLNRVDGMRKKKN
jgi:predicted HicB family RNase H-like nuclease